MRVLAIAFAVLLPGVGRAQCPIQTLSATTVGGGCNTGPTGCCARPAAPSSLRATLSSATCTLELYVDALEGCCGVAAPLSIVGIGFAPASIPLPPIGPGCALHVQVAVSAPTSGRSLRLPLLGVTPVRFRAQAVTLHTTPFGPDALTLSNALEVAIR